MVTCMGFEPMNTTLRGWRVEPLHQQAKRKSLHMTFSVYHTFFCLTILAFKKRFLYSIRMRSDT